MSEYLENNGSPVIIVTVILLVSLLLISPVLFYGCPNGSADLIHHLQIANAYVDSLRNGVLLPDWVTPENHSYGAVTVRFYPPLMHYTLAIFRLLLGNWNLALFAAFSLWLFIGGIGVYYWSRDLFNSEWQAMAAAVLSLFIPYHLIHFYNASMFGEFAAFSILPFGFLFARRVCIGGILNVIGLSICIALLILSNLPQTIVGGLCIGIYSLFYLTKAKWPRQITLLFLSGVGGLALSAFYWVRVVVEMPWIVISQPPYDPDYDYRNHFLLNSLNLDNQGVWFVSLIFAGSVTVVIIALTVSAKHKELRTSRELWLIVVLFLVGSFMLLPLSKPIWDAFTSLQRVQFPWRFFSIVSLTHVILTALALGFITSENWRARRPAVLILSGLVIIMMIFSVKQIILGAAYVEPERFASLPETSASAKGLLHWRPIWANDKTSKIKDLVIAGGREASVGESTGENREILVAGGEPVRARLAILYYPLWKASINGESVPVESDGGAIAIDLPATPSHLLLTFAEPGYSLVSRYVSLAALAALSILFVVCIFITRFRTHE